MSPEDRRNLDPCHCCEPLAPAAPVSIWNRPALPAVEYRVGTFASFRQAIFDAIADKAELREWTTRRSEDYGIAVTEMWAYLADVLTFYQACAVNEAFLRTALHRDSVLRLAALLGYQIKPGVAATADLTFTLDKEKKLQIPVGLRVQSVPAPGEKPQKFETIQAIAADAQLNSVRVYAEPLDRLDLQAGGSSAFLRPSTQEVVCQLLEPSDQLVIYRFPAPVEEKEVEDIEHVDGYKILRWKPGNIYDMTGGTVRKWTGKYRVFGHDAPERYLKSFPIPESPTMVRWVELYVADEDRFLLHGRKYVQLNAIFEDFKPGTRVLITGIVPMAGVPAVFETTVTAVNEQRVTRRGLGDISGGSTVVMSATVTVLELEDALTATFYRPSVNVYLLEDDEIYLWGMQFGNGDEIVNPILEGSGLVYVPLEQLSELESGRRIVLDDRHTKPHVATTTQTSSVDTDGDGSVDHLAVSFTPSLERDLDAQTAVLYGNVAQATHGETVAREVLGDGDASADFQQFSLKKSPVTFVPDATAPRGAASTLEVRVSGVRWQEASVLYGQPSDARVYRTRIDDESVTTVQFGDGCTGARLPGGRSNVVATYRQGLGLAGRVGAGSLTKLLDRPAGLKAVTNPVAAEGGADPESLDEARCNAPNTVRTFDRIVSLRDFEDAAREFTGIAKARAAWEWDGAERVVQLAVACDAGAELGPDTKESLVAYLDARRDPYRKMRVQDYTPRPVLVYANILSHPDHLPEDVQQAAATALLDFFAFENRDLGQGLHLSDLYHVLQKVDGVAAAEMDAVIYKAQEGWPEDLDELRRRGLRFADDDWYEPVQPRLPACPSELLGIDEPETDLLMNVRSET